MSNRFNNLVNMMMSIRILDRAYGIETYDEISKIICKDIEKTVEVLKTSSKMKEKYLPGVDLSGVLDMSLLDKLENYNSVMEKECIGTELFFEVFSVISEALKEKGVFVDVSLSNNSFIMNIRKNVSKIIESTNETFEALLSQSKVDLMNTLRNNYGHTLYNIHHYGMMLSDCLYDYALLRKYSKFVSNFSFTTNDEQIYGPMSGSSITPYASLDVKSGDFVYSVCAKENNFRNDGSVRYFRHTSAIIYAVFILLSMSYLKDLDSSLNDFVHFLKDNVMRSE